MQFGRSPRPFIKLSFSLPCRDFRLVDDRALPVLTYYVWSWRSLANSQNALAGRASPEKAAERLLRRLLCPDVGRGCLYTPVPSMSPGGRKYL